MLDRDRPIAEIVPVSRGGTGAGATDREQLSALAREGLVRVGTGRLPRALLHEPPVGKGSGVLQALLDERESGR